MTIDLLHIPVLMTSWLLLYMTIDLLHIPVLMTSWLLLYMTIDLLHIPEIIRFMRFYASYFKCDGQHLDGSSGNNGKNKELEYNFPTICRYFSLVEIQRILENAQVAATFKFCTDCVKIYLLFHWNCILSRTFWLAFKSFDWAYLVTFIPEARGAL
jgi:hypothetical protein